MVQYKRRVAWKVLSLFLSTKNKRTWLNQEKQTPSPKMRPKKKLNKSTTKRKKSKMLKKRKKKKHLKQTGTKLLRNSIRWDSKKKFWEASTLTDSKSRQLSSNRALCQSYKERTQLLKPNLVLVKQVLSPLLACSQSILPQIKYKLLLLHQLVSCLNRARTLFTPLASIWRSRLMSVSVVHQSRRMWESSNKESILSLELQVVSMIWWREASWKLNTSSCSSLMKLMICSQEGLRPKFKTFSNFYQLTFRSLFSQPHYRPKYWKWPHISWETQQKFW